MLGAWLSWDGAAGGSQPGSVEARPQEDSPSSTHNAGEDTDCGEGKTQDVWRVRMSPVTPP